MAAVIEAKRNGARCSCLDQFAPLRREPVAHDGGVHDGWVNAFIARLVALIRNLRKA